MDESIVLHHRRLARARTALARLPAIEPHALMRAGDDSCCKPDLDNAAPDRVARVATSQASPDFLLPGVVAARRNAIIARARATMRDIR